MTQACRVRVVVVTEGGVRSVSRTQNLLAGGNGRGMRQLSAEEDDVEEWLEDDF